MAKWKCDTCGHIEDDTALKCSLCGFGEKPVPVTPEQIQPVIGDARQILANPDSWTNCFALATDGEGSEAWDVWQPENLDNEDLKMSLCGALELAAHRRKHRKAVMDAVVRFIYPLCWSKITAPYPYPYELVESHRAGDGHYLYEELGYFNDQDDRTHGEVLEVLNIALAHCYTKTQPSLPQPREAMLTAFTGLREENRRKGIK